jgi:hypothetical protein
VKTPNEPADWRCNACGLQAQNLEMVLVFRERDRKASQAAIAQIIRARRLQYRIAAPEKERSRISTMFARAFAILKDAPGVEPWDPDALWTWATGQADRRLRYTAAFVFWARTGGRRPAPLDFFDALQQLHVEEWAEIAEWTSERFI